jgi:transcriptional regulator with XRE-family HTH domain
MARGLSREKLAAAAGISVRAIYNAERLGVCPQPATREVLARVLRCSPDDLIPPDAGREARPRD